jgi:hypothetical protein
MMGWVAADERCIVGQKHDIGCTLDASRDSSVESGVPWWSLSLVSELELELELKGSFG